MQTNKSSLLRSILIPVLVGVLAGLASHSSIAIYKALEKPALNPPGIVFPIVWTILYIVMGLSYYIISCSSGRHKNSAIILYYCQLFVNFFWSILFFRFQQYWLSAIWLLLLIVLVVLMIRVFYRIEKAAGLLNIPYLVWCLFALYLNLGIAILN